METINNTDPSEKGNFEYSRRIVERLLNSELKNFKEDNTDET